MNIIRGFFLYILALIVLLAPAIILGWMGASLFGWLGLVMGVVAGLVIFGLSVNKIAAQDADDNDNEDGAEEPASGTTDSVPPVRHDNHHKVRQDT